MKHAQNFHPFASNSIRDDVGGCTHDALPRPSHTAGAPHTGKVSKRADRFIDLLRQRPGGNRVVRQKVLNDR